MNLSTLLEQLPQLNQLLIVPIALFLIWVVLSVIITLRGN